MGLFQNLIELYDKQINDKNTTLPPIYHDYKSSKTNPLLVIKIDKNGNFIEAYEMVKDDIKSSKTLVGKQEKSIVYPLNGKSFARSGKNAKEEMHAIFDLFEYFDFEENEEGMKKYISNLENWCHSDYSHPKIEALLRYIKQGSLGEDVARGRLDINKKWFLLFEVAHIKGTFEDRDDSDKLWENKIIRKKYVDYYENCVLNQNEKKDVCYITGDRDIKTKDFFKFCGNPKLISANDGTNFTYRGRFINENEALNIGMHANQKFSIALKWLLENQGFTVGESKFILWENEVFLKKVFNRPWGSISSMAENYSTGNKVYLNEFMKAVKALKMPRENLKNGIAKMNILILEASGKGRMSIRYYREMSTEEYLDNILNWHKEGNWEHFRYVKEDKKSEKSEKVFFEGMPSILDIVTYAYGNERENGFIEIDRDKFFGTAVTNLLPCIIEGKKFPESIVKQLVHKTSNRQCYDNGINWECVLSAACSCVKKYLFDKNGEEYKMALDENITDRNYLYGRLLAVADKIEIGAQYKKNNNVKETNAVRYMNAFSQRPFKTWQIIEERIQPYLVSLDSKKKYSDLLNKIHSKFKLEDYENNNKLSGLYLLGYHCQMMALDPKNTENNKEEDEDEQ